MAHFALTALMLGVGSRIYVHLMGFLKKNCRDPLDLVRDIEVTIPVRRWSPSSAHLQRMLTIS